MLIIKRTAGESIERTLKKYKNKVRKTKQLKRIRDKQEFTKKSKLRRDRLVKAIYRDRYIKNQEE